ncbi:MAG: AEC family transporter [Blautia sp.]
MTTFEILLQQIGLFVIYILAGVTLVRTKVLNRETLEPISKFVIKMALPVMIFINIIGGGKQRNSGPASWSIPG